MVLKRSRKIVKRIKRKTKTKKSLVKLVEKIVHKNVENKTAFLEYTGQVNGQIATNADVIQILPLIGPGVLSNQRIGDVIRGLKLNIKGILINNGGSFTTEGVILPTTRMAIRLMIVQPKRYGSFADTFNSSAGWLGQLLEKGNSFVGFSGVSSDLWAKINTKEIVKYYDRIYYFTQSNIFVPTVVEAAYTAVMDGGYKFVNINLKMKNKKINYNDNYDGFTRPVSYNPVMIMGVVMLNGDNTYPEQNTIIMNFTSNFTYEDA